MLASSSYDRRLVMELGPAAAPHYNTHSVLLDKAAAAPAPLSPAHRRRSSASQIIPLVSQGLLVATATGQKRSPLAPLDPHFSPSQITDFEMSPEDGYPSGRKSSTTLTNATRPTPYSQRNLPRRPLPGQHRRTSLPALQPQDVPVQSPAELAPPLVGEDTDIYSRLSTFTFGDAQASKLQPAATSSSPSSSRLDDENVSPLHRYGSFDKTPRPSVAHIQHVPKPSHGWSSPSSDEDDRRRTNTRSKMRAIDDGTRRPSLPINDLQQLHLVGSDIVQASADKGKGKAVAPDENTTRQRGTRSSPTHTEGEGGLELDTDVDLMSADDTDRRRKGRDRTGGRAGLHTDSRISSDAGSFFGDSGNEADLRRRDGLMPMDEEDLIVDSYAVERKDSARTWTEHMGRRGSLPMDIPTTSGSGTTRGSQSQAYHDLDDFDAQARARAQLRRPSRSVDDDLARMGLYLQRRASLGAHGVPDEGALASSEPDMRGFAIAQAMVAAAAAAEQQGVEGSGVFAGDELGMGPGPSDEPYQGLDLNYILSVSGPMGGALGGAAEKRAGDAWSGRLSVGSSVAAREARERERQPSWADGWSIASGRRQSTATVNDDTFLRFVKKHDYSYDERKREWTFAREPHENSGHELKPGQEIWRCLWVGRYRVDRVQRDNTDPAKPATVRLNIKHLNDPHSKAGTRGGPLTFIHKHSRAQAFSIFRGHRLPERHLKTSSSILLATKKVQEQFTQTHSTSKLSTHGLLEDATSSMGRSEKALGGSGTNSATTSTASVNSSNRTPTSSATSLSKMSAAEHGQLSGSSKPRLSIERVDNASKGKGALRSPTNISTPNSSVGDFRTPTTEHGASDTDTPRSRVSVGHAPSLERQPRPMGSDGRPVSMAVSMATSMASYTSEGSQQFSSAISAWDQSSINSGNSSTRAPKRAQDLRKEVMRLSNPTRGSVGSLEEAPVVRTSHAEAFATLNPLSIEYLRSHSANYDGSSDHDSSSRRFGGLRKLFHAPPRSGGAKTSPPSASGSTAVLEGHFTPPWLTMAARSRQEEQERVLKNLNDSFRDVGLLPSFKPNRTRSHKKGKRVSENVIDMIPDNSLYMLLPMWPGETDPASARAGSGEEENFELDIQERQYLLVYYVANELNKDKSDDKKRSRSQTPSAASHTDASSTRAGSSISSSKNTVALSSFNILARLVSHRDVNGTGIRVPTAGLSVTGPFMDAVRAIPRVRFEVDDLALMIAFCASRTRGVEVVPEGAEKLGLCLPRTSPDPDSDAPLSPLGRAAVEMAWLGALAVMGFASVA